MRLAVRGRVGHCQSAVKPGMDLWSVQLPASPGRWLDTDPPGDCLLTGRPAGGLNHRTAPGVRHGFPCSECSASDPISDTTRGGDMQWIYPPGDSEFSGINFFAFQDLGKCPCTTCG